MNEAELRQLRGRAMHILGDVEALASYANSLLGAHPLDKRPFPVQYLRRQRGWSQARVISELEKAASDCGHKPPQRQELQQLVSGWERGLAPSAFHRELLRIIFSSKRKNAQTGSRDSA